MDRGHQQAGTVLRAQCRIRLDHLQVEIDLGVALAPARLAHRARDQASRRRGERADPQPRRDDAKRKRELATEGVPFLAEPYSPPWGGSRFFCVDPDGYLVEIEQPA